jgi:hypothetical protein
MNIDYSSEVDPLLLFPLSAYISSWGKLLSQPYTQERQRVGLREYRNKSLCNTLTTVLLIEHCSTSIENVSNE